MGTIIPTLFFVVIVYQIIKACFRPNHPWHKFVAPVGEAIVETSCIGPILDAQTGQSKLHKAAYVGDLARCTRLIEQGADLNLLNKAGASPLHSALYFSRGLDDWQTNLSTETKYRRATGKFEVAKLLIAKGASKTLADSFKKTPLEVAPDAFACARAGLLEGMKYMIEIHELDPMAERPSFPGETLLHNATFCGKKWTEGKKLCTSAVSGKAQTAQYLMSLGLSPDAPNATGRTPRDTAYLNESDPFAKSSAYGPNRALFQALNNVLGPAPAKPLPQPGAPAPTFSSAFTVGAHVLVDGVAYTVQYVASSGKLDLKSDSGDVQYGVEPATVTTPDGAAAVPVAAVQPAIVQAVAMAVPTAEP